MGTSDLTCSQRKDYGNQGLIQTQMTEVTML